MTGPATPSVFGPYQREADTRTAPMPKQVKELHDMGRVKSGDPARLVFGVQHAALLAACDAAGVDLGTYDRRILAWLADPEPQVVQVLIGLITRANAAGRAAVSGGTEHVDRYTRRLLHTSMHNRCMIWIGGRIQDDVNGLREAVGLEELGWNDAVPDEEVGRCTVHEENCEGQHTHNPPVRGRE